MSCAQVEQPSFHKKRPKCLQELIDSEKDIIGLVTITEDKTSLELNCLFCKDEFNDLLLFYVHFNSNHFESNQKTASITAHDLLQTDSRQSDELNSSKNDSINKVPNHNNEENVDRNYMQENELPEFELVKVSLDVENPLGIINRENKKPSPIEKRQHTTYLIDLYKQNPVLWNPQIVGYSSSQLRNKVFVKIAKKLSEKFSTSQTAGMVKRKLSDLRAKFKKDSTIVSKDERSLELWCYEKLSFLAINEKSDASDLDEKQATIDNGNALEQLSSRTQHTDMTMTSPEQFKKDVASNSFFIDLYKSRPCLWDQKNLDYMNPEKRKEAREFLVKSMKEKWDINLSGRLLQQKISLMQFLFEQEKPNDESSKEKPWYYSKLLFLKKEPKNLKFQMKGVSMKEPQKVIPKVNDESKQYICEVCQKQFKSELSLKNHLFSKHTIRAFHCKICNKAFQRQSALQQHSYTHLKVEDRPYTCKTCGMKFANAINWSVHERRHTKSFSHSCNTCGKQFFTSMELKSHMRLHTGEKPFVCDECGSAFRTSSAMTTHQRRHKKDRIFKCTTCPMAFYTPDAMRNHAKTHSDIRNYKCNICGKSFKLANTLRQHKFLHLDKRRYNCKICGRSFSQHAELHGHMKTHSIAEFE